jgi:uncharacterized protein HemX
MLPVEPPAAAATDPKNIEAAARAIALIGVPAVIALYLVYILAGQVQVTLDAHSLALTKNDAALTAVTTAHQEQLDELKRQGHVLQLICYNGAANDADRRRCFE